jgi:ribose transport system permease protein
VIIGGASFFGGRGTVVGALIGALILGTMRNGLNLLDVSTNWQLIAIGVVIAVAVEMDVIRGWLETRLRVARTEMLEGKGK